MPEPPTAWGDTVERPAWPPPGRVTSVRSWRLAGARYTLVQGAGRAQGLKSALACGRVYLTFCVQGGVALTDGRGATLRLVSSNGV